ncbi:DUF2909 domain-containing protein [Aeromonas veronii]|uniref:DUF2909 domain-containing protein n=1 Tax=Aeromonas TaxID=642 RepID=UPI0032ED223B
MLIKVVLVFMLLLIIGQLFHALWLMMTTKQATRRMSAPLGRRVFFSLLVVAILLFSLMMGWLEPNPRPY